ncbi:unnamed protein product [Alopecurus aequalis]
METESATKPLLGPPVIRGARPSSVSAAADGAATSHPFLDLLDAAFNAPSAAEIKASLKPRRGLTENCSATYGNSGNPCLDFFFQVVPDTPPERVRGLLAAAWAHDALTALKLACNLRGVRGTGKSDKEGFYAAALWMHTNHPKTLACNVAALAEFGYLKDFPELLFRLIHGPDVRKAAKERAAADKTRRKEKELTKQREALRTRLTARKRARELAPPKPTFGDFLSAALSSKTGKSKPAAAKKTAKRGTSKKVRKVAKLAVQSLETYYGDRAYRFLFDSVAEFFADLLASDLEQMANGGRKKKIGLAAKWCPTPGSSFDRTTLLCEAIARRLFPRDSNPEYAQLTDDHYTYQVLHRLRREVLVPLRKHDEERFAKYLEDVAEGKAKIAAGALLPHEIAAAAYRGEDDEVSELQWRRMVEDLRAKGSLSNCISVCDVSGSMSGTPMEGKTLREKMAFVRHMEWNMNTNFQAVFDQILRTAVEARLAPEKMIRTVFVYSDMEFDEASGRNGGYHYGYGARAPAVPWETDYEVICKKYRAAGYGDVVPQIVFWNLRDSSSTPVTSTQPGVAMVSGFSKNLLKIFLQNDGVVNPEAIMNAAIAGDEYQKLAVYD